MSTESYFRHMTTLAMHRPTISMIPGTQPASNMSMMDSLAVTAYVTMGMEGGMTTPKVPAEAAMAAALAGG